MRRTLPRALVAALLLVALLLPFAALTVQACTTDYIRLAENTGGGGDRVTLCAGQQGWVTNLKYINHSQAGTCNAPVKLLDNWEDCASSAYGWFDAPDGTLLTREPCGQLFANPEGGGTYMGSYSYYNRGYWRNLSPNDALSSIVWGNTIVSGGSWYCDITP